MTALFPRSYANEPRFVEATFQDDGPNEAADKALDSFRDVLSAVEGQMDKLAIWRHSHERAVEYGEARDEAAANIDGITSKLREIEATLGKLVREARDVAA